MGTAMVLGYTAKDFIEKHIDAILKRKRNEK